MVQSPVTFLGWFIGESKGGVTLSLNTIVEHLSNLLLYYRVHVDCLHMKDGNILTGIIEKVEKKIKDICFSWCWSSNKNIEFSSTSL